jgi:hypothetical protein
MGLPLLPTVPMFFALGFFTTSAVFGTTTLTSNGAADAYVVKLNASNGAVSWAVNYGGTSGDSPHGICLDASNNIYMLNSFNTSYTSCSATYTSVGSSDIVIQKMNPSDGFLHLGYLWRVCFRRWRYRHCCMLCS